MEVSKRNKAIEALRFLFMLQICVWHFGYPVTQTGFAGVEFYFILSGFFIFINSIKTNAPSIIGFTIGKASKFYIKYVLACVLGWIVFGHTLTLNSIKDITHAVLMFLSQLLMLQGIGIYEGGLNSPLWFFSVLIFGGAIVYGALRYYRDLSVRLIFPLIALLFLTYCFSQGYKEDLENFSVVGCIPMQLARGICEMALGSLVGYLYIRFSSHANKHLGFVNIATIVSVVGYIAILLFDRHDVSYVFILFPVFIMAAMTHGSVLQKIFHHEIWLKLGALSFDLYLIHAILIALTKHFLLRGMGLNFYWVCAVYYISLIPCALIFDKFSKYLQKRFALKSKM